MIMAVRGHGSLNLAVLVRRPTGSFSWGPAPFLRFTSEWEDRSIRTVTDWWFPSGWNRSRRDQLFDQEKNCCRGWYESELRLVLRMPNPAMLASVCLRRHEDAPTLPPKRRSQAPPPQNAWANNRPGVSHHPPGTDRASAGDLS